MIEKSGWDLVEQLQAVYERASFTDILSVLAFLIPLLFLASRPLLWALRKSYNVDVKRFEEENPHLKGRYFSFWNWLDIRRRNGNISSKHYKKRFDGETFINTDRLSFEVQRLKHLSKGFGKKFSLLTKTAIVLLVVIMAGTLIM